MSRRYLTAALSTLAALMCAAAPTSTPTEQAFESYVAFSGDGLVLAFAERAPEGLRLQWLSSTTNTVEKTSPLATPDNRRAAVIDLAADGFPSVGSVAKAPSNITAEVIDGRVVVRFSGMPAARPFKPFGESKTTIEGVSIVAQSSDRKYVALRVTGHMTGNAAVHVMPEIDVVTLFE